MFASLIHLLLLFAGKAHRNIILLEPFLFHTKPCLCQPKSVVVFPITVKFYSAIYLSGTAGLCNQVHTDTGSR